MLLTSVADGVSATKRVAILEQINLVAEGWLAHIFKPGYPPDNHHWQKIFFQESVFLFHHVYLL